MKEIQLTRGYVALVDDEDFERVNAFKWNLVSNKPGNLYAQRYPSTRGTGHKRISMHRLIVGATDGVQVDHIDGNGLNNQRSNLRVCSSFQNNWNRRKRSGCTSTYKGVAFYPPSKSWRASITCRGKQISLGYWTSEVDAARAYDNAAKSMYGEFARLNFPTESKGE